MQNSIDFPEILGDNNERFEIWKIVFFYVVWIEIVIRESDPAPFDHYRIRLHLFRTGKHLVNLAESTFRVDCAVRASTLTVILKNLDKQAKILVRH